MEIETAQRMLAANGHATHVDAQGRVWARYEFSHVDYWGEAYEVLPELTRQALRDWMGF